MTCLTLKAHCEASAAAAGQECVSGGMLLTRQGMLRTAAAAEICLRPTVDYAYTNTYVRMHPVVVVAAAASIIGVAAIAAAIDSLSAE